MNTETDSLSLVSRAAALTENSDDWLEELAILGQDISACFQQDYKDSEVRGACEELLTRERLPALYRAQFLVYMTCSEEEDAHDAMLERIEDAQYWINDVEYVMRERGLEDPRVETLKQGISEMRAQITEAVAETAKSDPYASAPAHTRPGVLMKASEIRPETYGPPISADEKYKGISEAKDLERTMNAQTEVDRMQERNKLTADSLAKAQEELIVHGIQPAQQHFDMHAVLHSDLNDAFSSAGTMVYGNPLGPGSGPTSTLSVRTRAPVEHTGDRDAWGRPAPSASKYVPPALRKAKSFYR